MELERRITYRLVNYWQEIKGDNILPPESAIDSEDIPDLWDDCFIIQVNNRDDLTDERAYSYSYVGRSLTDLLLENGNGVGEGDLLTLPPENLIASFTEMQMTKLPVTENVEGFILKGRRVKYRQVLLPCGDDRGTILSIFGGMRYRLIAPI